MKRIAIFAVVLMALCALPALAQVPNGHLPLDKDGFFDLNSPEMLARIEAMRAEIRSKGWTFEVGANPAMRYDLNQLCGRRVELLPPEAFQTQATAEGVTAAGKPPGKKPTPTPAPTRTPTPKPTQTPTPTPAAAHIRLALFANLASPNLDGTMSGVISALVTDATGAVVGNGVVVQFSILPVTPTPSGAPAVPAGVSVTSPGVTGEAAPCVLCFQVPPQPGDALSCVKYDAALGGQTVTIRAVVQTPSGPLTDTELITLPPSSLQCPV